MTMDIIQGTLKPFNTEVTEMKHLHIKQKESHTMVSVLIEMTTIYQSTPLSLHPIHVFDGNRLISVGT